MFTPKKLRKCFKIASLLAIIPLPTLLGMQAGNDPDPKKVGCNFHRVDKNLYRSGLVKNLVKFEKVLDDFNIKTVVAFTKKMWEQEEEIIGKKKGITLKFATIESNNHPKLNHLIELIQILKNSIDKDQAVWMHDKDGANRTGLASALYIILLAEGFSSNEERMKKAGDQFSSFKYGYASLLQHYFNNKNVMDFALKFGKCYLDLCDLVKKESLNLTNLSEEEESELQEKVGDSEFKKILTYAIELHKLLH